MSTYEGSIMAIHESIAPIPRGWDHAGARARPRRRSSVAPVVRRRAGAPASVVESSPRPSDRLRAVDAAIVGLSRRLGRCPSTSEVASELALEVEEVLDALHAVPLARDPWMDGLVLRLRLQGLTQREIARRLGVGPLTAMRLLRSAVGAV